MDLARFELERWQSLWEHRVEINLAESGVEPLSLDEALGDEREIRRLLAAPLGYPPTDGFPDLRARIAALYPEGSAEGTLVTCGCAEANLLVAWTLVEPNDEVVFVQPNYLQVAGLVQALGGRIVPVDLREERRWILDPDDVVRSITPRTRLVVVCHPNNPTGAVLDESAIDSVCRAAARVGAWILADEVYRGAEHSGGDSPSFHGRQGRVICTGGLSKAYGLPGLRIGWIAAAPELVERAWSRHDYTTIAAGGLDQRIASLVLEVERRCEILARTRTILTRNYALVARWVDRHAGRLRHVQPAAGANAWIGLPDGIDARALAERLRVRQSVLVVPGEQCGRAGHLRIGFGGDAALLERGLARIDEEL